MSYFTDVREFQLKFWPEYVVDRPSWRHLPAVLAAYRHVLEEVDELGRALEARDLEGALDAVVDAVYVLCGLAVRLGLPLDEAWERVHRANLAKARGAGPRGAIDVVKPPGWEPPVLRDLVETAED